MILQQDRFFLYNLYLVFVSSPGKFQFMSQYLQTINVWTKINDVSEVVNSI